MLARVSQLTTISQHERAWTGAFDLLVGRRLLKQCEAGNALQCIPLGGDMSNIERVEKVLETEVGIRAQERAFEEATRRFGKEVTSRQCIAAILDVRTKSLSHFEDINEKHKAKDFLRKAYISWGVQAHRFSDALLQQAVKVKLEASRSADAEAEEPSGRRRNGRSQILWIGMMTLGKGMCLQHWNSSLKPNLHVCG